MPPRFVFAVPPANPLLQILYLLVGAVVVVAALVIGGAIFAFVFGIALVFGIVLWIRIWWLQRKFRRAAGQGAPGQQGRPVSSSNRGVEITGVEYHVVREKSQDED